MSFIPEEEGGFSVVVPEPSEFRMGIYDLPPLDLVKDFWAVEEIIAKLQ